MKAVRILCVLVVLTSSWAATQVSRPRDAEVYDPPNPTALLRVEVLAEVEGRTTVVLVASSDFQPFGFRHYRIIEGTPREVFHLRGIERLLEGDSVEVGDANVIRIRLGLHLEHKPPELSVVFDLTDQSVLTESAEYDGNRLVVSFVAPGVAQVAIPATPTMVVVSATHTPTRTPTPAPTPTPTPTRTRTPTPTPTPTPTMMPIATPTKEPAVIPATAPLAVPTVSAIMKPTMIPIEASPQPTPEPSRRAADGHPDEDVMIFTEISVSRWPDGSTLIRISADRNIPPDRITHFRLFGEPPRYVIGVSGAKAPELPGVIEFSDANLGRVRLIRRSANEIGELQFVLELVATGATIEKFAHQGAHIALRIVPPPQ